MRLREPQSHFMHHRVLICRVAHLTSALFLFFFNSSLPAYDSKYYYDSEYEDSEDLQDRSEGCSNWGRKHDLASRSRHVGRMPGWSRTMPTTFDESERASKRQKRNTLHPQLIFSADAHSGLQDAGLETDEDQPARARLEPPPTNPVEVLTRLSNMRTFCTPRQSSVFSSLALNAISLIETDHKCVKALNRTCSILRGDDLSWLPSDKTEPLSSQSNAAANTDNAGASQQGSAVDAAAGAQDPTSTSGPSASTSNATTPAAIPSAGPGMPESATGQAGGGFPSNNNNNMQTEEPDIVLGQPLASGPSAEVDLSALQPGLQNANGAGGSRKRNRESSPSAFELSLRLKKIIDPAGAVESLFVSPTPVAVPSSGTTAIVSLHEQKLLLHAGLLELSRFLADCLEYQARLREISDQAHAVDRRRRGLYTIIKRFVSASSSRAC